MSKRMGLRECDTHFPHDAREFVDSTLSEWGIEEAAPTMDLLVSELVTYALVGGEFDHAAVDLTYDAGLLRVAVTDPTSYLAAVVSDLPPIHTMRAGGLGLFMVDSVAERWAVEPAGDGTTVWFEIEVGTAIATAEAQRTADV